jgi:hypothetical protein
MQTLTTIGALLIILFQYSVKVFLYSGRKLSNIFHNLSAVAR